MKTAFKILLILIVAGFLIWSFIGVDKKADDRVCQGVELIVEDSLSLGLIDKEDVLAIMKSQQMSFEGKKLVDINMGQIERALSSSPYIDTVNCSVNAGGQLLMRVLPKVPALYVIPDKGEPYLLDRKGSDMPVGDLTGNLCVATGNISKKFASSRLAAIASCIQDSAFWRAQVQQIEVVNEHDIRMYTRFADHVVLLGEAKDLPDQLWRLRVFYGKGLSEIGWNKYESVSVAYKGIVIGKGPDDGSENEMFVPPVAPAPEAAADSLKASTPDAQGTANVAAEAAPSATPSTNPSQQH